MNNNKAEALLPEITFSDQLKLGDFLPALQLNQDLTDNFSLQCYPGGRAMRCDYSRLLDKKGMIAAYLFVFTDSLQENDLLTGFHTWDSFLRFITQLPNSFDNLATAAVIDIDSLGSINHEKGRKEGDQLIRKLARLMQEVFPRNAYFLRGVDAKLIAICPHLSEGAALTYCHVISERFEGSLQYAVSQVGTNNRDVVLTIEEAQRAMYNKKLLDEHSSQSQMIASLVRALKVCDSETEAHVQRTQKMGAALGRCIGLTDVQQSDLALLCLLHDIGKIAIPLEILNKPGKLSKEEWLVLRSHTEKGYQIAKSSRELEGIAEMILCHHERWDGKGYPAGLKHEAIPLLSRVISVVDSYDAMVNDRAYRQALTVEKAKQEIERGAGAQFDPDIVKAFLKMLDDHPEIACGEVVSGKKAEADVQEALPVTSPEIRQVYYSRYYLKENDEIIRPDDNFELITGYKQEDLAGMKQADLIPPEDREAYVAMVKMLLKQSSLIYLEHRIRRKNGEIIHVLCEGETYFDSAVKERRSRLTIVQKRRT